eukprot:1888118-Pyramimonas_sp.AAC.1
MVLKILTAFPPSRTQILKARAPLRPHPPPSPLFPCSPLGKDARPWGVVHFAECAWKLYLRTLSIAWSALRTWLSQLN